MTSDDTQTPSKQGILGGLKVLDASHMYSSALSGALLADLGAEVICVEHPTGSPVRSTLPRSKGQSLWWKNMARGKACITLNLSRAEGRAIFLEMAPQFDLMLENFRPGTLERWGLGPKDLEAAGANLVMLRISGFGQTGPMRDRPGFGTIAEAVSGFAYLNGFPDGPPVFPSTALADGVAATFGAFGLLAALVSRMRAGRTGVEVVDVALFEALHRLSPMNNAVYDQLGIVMERPGNYLGSQGIIRNLYECADGRYFVISTVGAAQIMKVLSGTDAPAELIARFEASVSKEKGMAEDVLQACDRHIKAWAAARDWPEVSARLQAADVVHERVYNAEDIARDPHYQAREAVVSVPDDQLGRIALPGIVPKFPGWDHKVGHGGPALGAHNAEIYRRYLGFDETKLAALKRDGVI